jgi:hypothetical protein
MEEWLGEEHDLGYGKWDDAVNSLHYKNPFHLPIDGKPTKKKKVNKLKNWVYHVIYFWRVW